MSQKSIPEASVDTRLLYERLRKLAPGDNVTYEELSSVIGRDVQNSARSNLASARRMCENEDRIVTAAVTNVGIKRLLSSEIPATAEAVRAHVGRMTRRGIRKLGAVDLSELTPEQKIKHSTETAHLGALAAFSSSKASRRIEEKVSTNKGDVLALAHTLDAFKG